VTYRAAYGNENAILYLYLPKKGKGPFQTVIFFPGSNALLLRTFTPYPTASLDAVVRSGRAVVFPCTRARMNEETAAVGYGKYVPPVGETT